MPSSNYNNNKNIALNCAWGVKKTSSGEYYIAYTHWIYLDFITSKFKKVYLVTTCSNSDDVSELNPLDCYNNLKIIEIPNKGSMIKSLANFSHYFRAYKLLKSKVNLVYCRVPDPFSWLPGLLFGKDCIMHFVGDPIEAAQVNEKWSKLRKWTMIAGYYPDLMLTLKMVKKSPSFCNGIQIAEKYSKYNIQPLISSTLLTEEIASKEYCVVKDNNCVHVVFTGFLREWKGVRTIMKVIEILEQKKFNYTFDILGDGNMYQDLYELVKRLNIEDHIKLHGFVNNRKFINDLYRKSDIYMFPSLGGEGSPRSVIEAIAQGLLVVSTPVGSLPSTFTDKEHVRFVNYNDADAFVSIITNYHSMAEDNNRIKKNALNLVRGKYTRDAFLRRVFNVV